MKLPRITNVLLACILIAPFARARPADNIRPERELLITDPAVVDSSNARFPGPWSFGTLVNELAGPEKAGECMRAWLETWVVPQTVNGFDVKPRRGILEKVIEPWQRRDGYDPKSGERWIPKVENAPFRLLAIVNRMDLCAAQVAGIGQRTREQWKQRGKEPLFDALLDRATNSEILAKDKPRPRITSPVLALPDVAAFQPDVFGHLSRSKRGVGSIGSYGFARGPVDDLQFGEGRFIFGAIGDDGRPLAGNWTVIFEYELPGISEKDAKKKDAPQSKGSVRPLPSVPQPQPIAGRDNRRRLGDWTSLWHMLSFQTPGTETYIQHLEKVTRSFTHSGVGQGGRNPPMLAQLRTSEAAFGEGREFRQFSLVDGKLEPTILSQTPAAEFTRKGGAEQQLLAEFLRENAPLIRSGIHSIPATLHARNENVPVLGGSAIIPAGDAGFHWNLQRGVDHPTRRIFSLNTCTGCHAGETGCATGLHVAPRMEGVAAGLSAFLRTDGKPLQIRDPVAAQPVEFREMEERATIFAALLNAKDAKRIEEINGVLRQRLGRSH